MLPTRTSRCGLTPSMTPACHHCASTSAHVPALAQEACAPCAALWLHIPYRFTRSRLCGGQSRIMQHVDTCVDGTGVGYHSNSATERTIACRDVMRPAMASWVGNTANKMCPPPPPSCLAVRRAPVRLWCSLTHNSCCGTPEQWTNQAWSSTRPRAPPGDNCTSVRMPPASRPPAPIKPAIALQRPSWATACTPYHPAPLVASCTDKTPPPSCATAICPPNLPARYKRSGM